MLRLALAVVTATASTVCSVGLAHADCASPDVATSPPPGATVPPDPTIYLFLPALGRDKPLTERIRATADGQPIDVRVDQVSTNQAFTTARVRIDTAGESQLTITYDSGWERGEVSYTIDSGWRRPPRRAVELTRVERRQDEWTCSFTDAWFLEVAGPADAYRVEWAASPAAWKLGAQSTLIFPRSEMDFWHRSDDSAPPQRAHGSIGLGHLNCFAHTIPAEAIDGPLHVKVWALFSDGSESAAWSEPRLIADRAPAAPPAPAVAVASPPDAPAPAATQPPAPTTIGTSLTTILVTTGAGAFAAALLIFLFQSAARARRRRLFRSSPPPR
jgi:hypothetical protein